MIGNLFEINLCAINDRLAVGEYMGLVNLLSPKGPVFQLVEKLTTQVRWYAKSLVYWAFVGYEDVNSGNLLRNMYFFCHNIDSFTYTPYGF